MRSVHSDYAAYASVHRVPPEATCTMAVRHNYAYPRLPTRPPRPTRHSGSGGRAPMSPEGVGATCAATPLMHSPRAHVHAMSCARSARSDGRALRLDALRPHAHGPACPPARPHARLTMALCMRAQTHADDTHVMSDRCIEHPHGASRASNRHQSPYACRESSPR